MHGTHAYSNSQAILAKYFSDINCECVAFDYRGHGKSGGTPGLIPTFNTLLEDATKFITEVSNLYPELPIFLLGFSLGGCLSIHLSIKFKEHIKGMMLISPGLSLNQHTNN